jgi:hypothetical protein
MSLNFRSPILSSQATCPTPPGGKWDIWGHFLVPTVTLGIP